MNIQQGYRHNQHDVILPKSYVLLLLWWYITIRDSVPLRNDPIRPIPVFSPGESSSVTKSYPRFTSEVTDISRGSHVFPNESVFSYRTNFRFCSGIRTWLQIRKNLITSKEPICYAVTNIYESFTSFLRLSISWLIIEWSLNVGGFVILWNLYFYLDRLLLLVVGFWKNLLRSVSGDIWIHLMNSYCSLRVVLIK